MEGIVLTTTRPIGNTSINVIATLIAGLGCFLLALIYLLLTGALRFLAFDHVGDVFVGEVWHELGTENFPGT
jgi:hypothetical protein